MAKKIELATRPQLTPVAVPQARTVLAATPAQTRAAWLTFVDQVERGEQQDPLGQYVSKSTKAEKGQRLPRPKSDASKGRHVAVLPLDGIEVYTMLPDDPCCPTSGPTPGAYSNFISREGLGGPGYIHDLKMISSVTEINPAPNTGYIVLKADLNRGAGGSYIYLTFTRDATSVVKGPEVGAGRSYASGPVTDIDVKAIDPVLFISPPKPPTYFYPIWRAGANASNQQYGLSELDLNEGSGGEFIYAYQTHGGRSSTPIEIGILSGTGSRIQPPTGWIRNNTDLNLGAAGDYIYLCFKPL